MSQGKFHFDSDDEAPATSPSARAPLAERIRPESFAEIVGQDDVIGSGQLVRDLIERDAVGSMILWGPPGCGKTTLARLIARHTRRRFVAFSAVLSGVKEVRQIIAEARAEQDFSQRGTILFVDEIHRFNKSQQDAFLPHVEDGTVVLVGATTENPSFEVNPALLSRCRVVPLGSLSEDALAKIARRALAEPARWGLPTGVDFTEDGLGQLILKCGGDARNLLNRLEALLQHGAETGREKLDAEAVGRALEDSSLRYDKSGEEHFNIMSAFHKSMRGSDPQAALYWLARMLEGGEDPFWVARRIVRFASEDIGLADPQAVQIAMAAKDSYHFLGRPEGLLALAQAAVYMATAPKSNAIYKAYGDVTEDIEAGAIHDVPKHLRNAPTQMMKDLGYGAGYQYAHEMADGISDHDHLPPELADKRWYEPSDLGFEKEVAKRMAWWEKVRRGRS